MHERRDLGSDLVAWNTVARRLEKARRVQKYKRTLRPARRAVAEFIYYYHGERNHQGLGNAVVFLDTTRSEASRFPLSRMDC